MRARAQARVGERDYLADISKIEQGLAGRLQIGQAGIAGCWRNRTVFEGAVAVRSRMSLGQTFARGDRRL